jgi:hypothetical protein
LLQRSLRNPCFRAERLVIDPVLGDRQPRVAVVEHGKPNWTLAPLRRVPRSAIVYRNRGVVDINVPEMRDSGRRIGV